MAKIEFSDVSFIEKEDIVLKNISLSIEEGELFMVKGPSKKEGRTFLQLIHRLIKPTEGKVTVTLKEGEFIGSNLIPFVEAFTVEEVISLPLKISGYSKIEAKNKTEEIARYFSIEGLLKKKMGDLTPCEKALVGISKAVVSEPALVILDEFSPYLDHKLAVLVMTYLHEISVDYEVTVVMVENDRKLHPFAGKILHLENGYARDLVGEGVDLNKLMPFLKI